MGISWYLAHLMVSLHVWNASIPELVKTTHVIDTLLSGESTVLTQGDGGGGGEIGTWMGKHVRPKSEWKGTFFGAEWAQLGYQNRQKCEKGYTFYKNLEWNGTKRGVFHGMSLKQGYNFSTLGPLNWGVFSEVPDAYAYPRKVSVPLPSECSDWDVVNQSNGTQHGGILRSWNFDDVTSSLWWRQIFGLIPPILSK